MKKAFYFLLASQLFANLGDIFYIVGLISILYQLNESTFVLALLPVLNMAGRLFSSTVAPYFINRWQLKHILFVSQLLKTLLLVCLFYIVTTIPLLIIICIMIFVIAWLDGLTLPASEAMLPRLVPRNKLIRANSLLSMMNESTKLGGWALGGIIVVMTSGMGIILLTILLYALATVAIGCIRDDSVFERKETRFEKSELFEGFQIIWKNRSFRVLQIAELLSTIANVVWVAAFIYIFVDDVLHVSEVWWGYINTTFFVGLLVGASIYMKLEHYLSQHFRTWLLLSSLLLSCTMLGFSINTWPLVALLLSAIFGFVSQLQGILMGTWLQLKADDHILVKMYSAQEVLNAAAFIFATLTVGYLAEFVDIQVIFIGASIVLAVAATYLVTQRKHFTKSMN